MKQKTKRTITLENGEIVDCGVKEFDDLKQSIEEQKPKEIALNSLKLLISSEEMMGKLTEGLKDICSHFRRKQSIQKSENETEISSHNP